MLDLIEIVNKKEDAARSERLDKQVIIFFLFLLKQDQIS